MRRHYSFYRSPRPFPSQCDFPAGIHWWARERERQNSGTRPVWEVIKAFVLSATLLMVRPHCAEGLSLHYVAWLQFFSPLHLCNVTVKSAQHTDMDEDLINNATGITPTPFFPPGATCTACDHNGLQWTRRWGRGSPLRGRKKKHLQ